MTLLELKRDLVFEIREIKEVLKELKDEQDGVDPVSGHYAQTGRYQTKLTLEHQVCAYSEILKRLRKVRKLR